MLESNVDKQARTLDPIIEVDSPYVRAAELRLKSMLWGLGLGGLIVIGTAIFAMTRPPPPTYPHRFTSGDYVQTTLNARTGMVLFAYRHTDEVVVRFPSLERITMHDFELEPAVHARE